MLRVTQPQVVYRFLLADSYTHHELVCESRT